MRVDLSGTDIKMDGPIKIRNSSFTNVSLRSSAGRPAAGDAELCRTQSSGCDLQAGLAWRPRSGSRTKTLAGEASLNQATESGPVAALTHQAVLVEVNRGGDGSAGQTLLLTGPNFYRTVRRGFRTNEQPWKTCGGLFGSPPLLRCGWA